MKNEMKMKVCTVYIKYKVNAVHGLLMFILRRIWPEVIYHEAVCWSACSAVPAGGGGEAAPGSPIWITISSVSSSAPPVLDSLVCSQ